METITAHKIQLIINRLKKSDMHVLYGIYQDRQKIAALLESILHVRSPEVSSLQTNTSGLSLVTNDYTRKGMPLCIT